jgi:hypothetical protein
MRRLLIPALLVALGMLTGIQAAGSAVIEGTDGPDTLNGTPRADRLYGRGGNDLLDGRSANDLIDGGAGRDRLSGSAGNDRLASSGDGRSDTVRCGIGRDIVNADLADSVAADCEIVGRQLSRDTDRSSEAQHETQVEPHSFAFGSTVVAVFQSGRFIEGGAASNGFATSRNGGRTWHSGLLPGLSFSTTPQGRFSAVSDPVVAYDARHRWWLAASLGSSFPDTALVVNRSRDGIKWNLPVTAAEGGIDYDKQWLVCDNWRRSRFRGRCYLSYMNFSSDLIETRRSIDGGRTWSAPVGVDGLRLRAVVNGVQPVVRPNGDLVIVFSVFGSSLPDASEIAAFRSTNGGLSFSAPVRVASLEDVELTGMRAPPFPSVDVDSAGTVYVAWTDCRFSGTCAAEIVLATSHDGVSWTDPVRLPTGPIDASVDYFLPALAVDSASPGNKPRIALLFHTLRPPTTCDPVFLCLAVDVGLIVSKDGGSTWARPLRLNATEMSLLWMADTSLGRMLGDYVSVSWVGGRPVPVFSLATPPSGGQFRQAIFATTRVPKS